MATTNTVYGGDEINAIVLDRGSLSTRIGYAGDDFPKVITPSYYAINETKSDKDDDNNSKSKRIFGDSINIPRSDYEIKPIMKDSVVIDWDAAIDQYTHYFEKDLYIDYKEQPIMITEPVWSSTKERKETIENFYENFEFPALYLAKTPTCISFQQGRPNCLVVDIGHDSVSITPVIDGISLIKNSLRTHYGGKFLSDQFNNLFTKKFPDVKFENLYNIKSKDFKKFPEISDYRLKDSMPKNITKSFNDYSKEFIFHEMKETLLEVSENLESDESKIKRLFELPTGQSIELGLERFEISDSLFNPINYVKDINYEIESGILNIDSNQNDYRPLKRARKMETNSPPPSSPSYSDSSDCRGLTQLISHSLSMIDIDLRASVAHNIIITGGVSLIPQLTERLYNELTTLNPGLKIRLHAIGNSSERINQAWIGGSVLSSLGTFHQLWVSKEEYEEAGADRILNQRFR